ncbi:sterol desaturase family protein [Candidatus Gracilibacteria bacterium]|jgi:sterol desaturase/sphingolipid hydroxylase (fatty acid hydroxylase superfamily)|nr:sterol desaturase family protein [Candidatus Gracilibacteria bacterium]NJM87119.1 sterol desaturase family protein [Hydrococcus sp. RU_2_2]NJP20385.1 sterol desaturase family protein [Hydrococcus sp. CRU_1_1]
MLTIISLILTFIFSSFLEYWLHRLMHIWPWFGNQFTSHYKHHQSQTANLLGDFKDYGMVAVIFCPIFLISPAAAIGSILGGLSFAAFASYSHHLQHQTPTRYIMMKVPVHYLHHNYSCRYNFGLSVDWWDRAFGTYRPMEWSLSREQATKNG